MRFISPDLSIPTNYFAQLEATDDELAALIRYLGFLVTEHVYEVPPINSLPRVTYN